MSKQNLDKSNKISKVSLIVKEAAELRASNPKLKQRNAVSLATEKLRQAGVIKSKLPRKARVIVDVTESTFVSKVKYIDRQGMAQTAEVRLVVNYRQQKFDLFNEVGNKDFCFTNQSADSAKWVAVLEAAKNAIEFGNKELAKSITN